VYEELRRYHDPGMERSRGSFAQASTTLCDTSAMARLICCI